MTSHLSCINIFQAKLIAFKFPFIKALKVIRSYYISGFNIIARDWKLWHLIWTWAGGNFMRSVVSTILMSSKPSDVFHGRWWGVRADENWIRDLELHLEAEQVEAKLWPRSRIKGPHWSSCLHPGLSAAKNGRLSRRLGFPVGPAVKSPPANGGDADSIPGSGRFPWRREWEPTLVFLPGISHGQRSLAGHSPWGG